LSLIFEIEIEIEIEIDFWNCYWKIVN